MAQYRTDQVCQTYFICGEAFTYVYTIIRIICKIGLAFRTGEDRCSYTGDQGELSVISRLFVTHCPCSDHEKATVAVSDSLDIVQNPNVVGSG